MEQAVSRREKLRSLIVLKLIRGTFVNIKGGSRKINRSRDKKKQKQFPPNILFTFIF